MADYISEEIRKTLVDYGKKFGNETIKQLVKELIKLKKVATGKLKDSFDFKLKGAIESFIIEFEAENYVRFVNDGRRPGKFAPVDAIESWCKTKGIDEKYAYLINLKIKTFGIKPTDFFFNVLNENKILKYSEGLEDALGRKLDLVLDNIFYQVDLKIK